MIGDPDRVLAIARAGQLGELISAYTRHTADTNPRIQTQVREQAQAQFLDMIRNGGAVTGQPDMRAARAGGAHNRRAPGAVLDGITGSAGEFFAAVHHSIRTPEADNQLGRIRAAMGSSVPADGGFLVPEEVRSDIISLGLESAIVRPRARVIPVSSPRTTFPAVDESTHVGHVFGGVSTTWAAEGSTMNPTAPKFGAISLESHKLGAYAEVNNELVQDVGALDAWIRTSFAAA
ncbi:MAG: phage major capsid protein, partial [Pseudonocardia sp.]|nr:phage major capsid protein [Pseudonocardia sp.]